MEWSILDSKLASISKWEKSFLAYLKHTLLWHILDFFGFITQVAHCLQCLGHLEKSKILPKER